MILTFLLKAKETKMLACRHLGAGQAMVPPSEHRRFGSGDTDRKSLGPVPWQETPSPEAMLFLPLRVVMKQTTAVWGLQGDFKETTYRRNGR